MLVAESRPVLIFDVVKWLIFTLVTKDLAQVTTVERDKSENSVYRAQNSVAFLS